jgi:hypothetical protein
MRILFTAFVALSVACGPVSPDPEPQRCASSIDDGDPCTTDACDPTTGAISHTPKCHDANVCSADACESGGACRHTALGSTATAILSGSPTGAMQLIPVPTQVSGSITVCPGGPDANATPPRCIVEVDFATAMLTFETVSGEAFSVYGTIPFRMQDLPVDVNAVGSTASGSVTLNGNDACPGAMQTFLSVPVDVAFNLGGSTGGGLTVVADVDRTAIESGVNVCGGLSGAGSLLAAPLADEIERIAEQYLTAQVEAQLCASAFGCPSGTTESGGFCRDGSGACVDRGVDPASGMLRVAACLQ